MTEIKQIRSQLLSSPIFLISLIFLAILLILTLLAPIIPIDPNAVDVSNMSKPPSLQHIFGTDEIGRDYFIRVLHGGRVSLLVGLLAMITATMIGTIVGLISGYFGGIVDNILMRCVDILSAIPWLILVIVLSVFLRPGLTTVIIVIGGFSWMRIARLIRAETLSAKEREYVIYAQFLGENWVSIIGKHILPSVLPTLIVAASTSISSAIMTESALSFLGMGIQQPMASWGSLLQNAQSSLQKSPYMAIVPGVCVVLTIYAFNNIGDMIKSIIQREEV